MDNIRGVCGCPVAGLTPHELLDASGGWPGFHADHPRQQGVHQPAAEVQRHDHRLPGELLPHRDAGHWPWSRRYRELEGGQVNGFNVLVGGKQGSGGYTPAKPSRRVRAAGGCGPSLCGQIVEIFRDHGARESRNKARLAFLIQDRGVAWFRAELERRWGQPLLAPAPRCARRHHVDHLGIHPQKTFGLDEGPQLYYAGPAGAGRPDHHRPRCAASPTWPSGTATATSALDRAAKPNRSQHSRGQAWRALTEEPLLKELSFDPSPIMRGLVTCVGIDYCHLALIETKGWAIEVARELEKRTAGQQGRAADHPLVRLLRPAAACTRWPTIGLQGCRTRVDGKVVDAAHVCVKRQVRARRRASPRT